ncbi:MAG: leucyl aminopeptidase [Bryobacterales bacterium]|nr:leucyl aminopeptidase [Bryobacteraceae bacterium]MDW8353102.1 leucyl aminopeptidase [Bryobacterales bacterium]
MQIQLLRQRLEDLEADAAAVVVWERTSPEAPIEPATAARINTLTRNWLDELFRSGEFRGKTLEAALLHRPPELKVSRLLVVGGGKRENFGSSELRKVAGAALRTLKSKGARSVAFLLLDPELADPENVAAAVEGILLGDYEPDRYKTDKSERKQVEQVHFVVSEARPAAQEALERGRVIAEAQNYARDLVSEPANRLTPTVLAERARQVASEYGLECEVLDASRMKQLGMGLLLGVAQGSSEPPALIVLDYRPESPTPGGAHLGLLGKGVTFDTGGISIKPSEGMEKMKYDMAGGAAVIGAMRAIAQLKPPVRVTGFVPAVENMPGGRAQRPGDIVTSLSGKTVEVLNTDAEGRLILADAITYAKRLGCTHLLDAATLTGAIVVALGHVNAGAFTNDEQLLNRVLAAARREGEKIWPMPLDEDYKDMLKSPFADIPNVGNRWGGAITAAMFLKEFVETTPWVHLDIAGTAWLEESKPHLAKGPTGMPLRTFVRVVLDWNSG